MKTIIFSDTHLTCRFRKRKFEYLIRLIKSADQIIINGDFWDGYLTKFDKFVKSKWNQLFPILKEKNTVYLYGNHDKKKWMDKRVKLFSQKQAEVYKFKSGDKKFLVQHGNKIYISIGDKRPILANKLTAFFALNFKCFGAKIFGHSFYRWFILSIKSHRKLYKWAKENFEDDVYYVFSHSHRAVLFEHDHFMNTGFVGQGNGSYVEIEDGRIKLIKEKY